MKTELLEKTSTQVYKWCWCCKQSRPVAEFVKNASKKDGYSTECKACKAEYQKSDVAKATHKRYRQSEYGKAMIKRWAQSEAGVISALRKRYRYRNTPWGYAMNREKDEVYAQSGEKRESGRRRYCEKQAEANYHHDPESFYSAYRMIKALETAEVVEIKL